MERKNVSLVLLIISISLCAYVGFTPLFDLIKIGVAREFIAAIFGTIFTVIITMVLLNKQTEVESQKNKDESVFIKKVELYQKIIDLVKTIFEDGQYTNKEIQSLDAYCYHLQLISSEKTLIEYLNFYSTIKKRLHIEIGDNEYNIEVAIPVYREDKLLFGNFIQECNNELLLDKRARNKSEIINRIQEAININSIYLSKPDIAKKKLVTYYRLIQILNGKGGPENNGNLFEEVLAKEDEILNLFHLPNVEPYNFFTVIDQETSIEEIITALTSYENEFLITDHGTKEQILQESIDQQKDYALVLPKIGISTHIYPIFLYQMAADNQKINIRDVLNEMETAENHLSEIAKLTAQYEVLSDANLKFLKEYLNSL